MVPGSGCHTTSHPEEPNCAWCFAMDVHCAIWLKHATHELLGPAICFHAGDRLGPTDRVPYQQCAADAQPCGGRAPAGRASAAPQWPCSDSHWHQRASLCHPAEMHRPTHHQANCHCTRHLTAPLSCWNRWEQTTGYSDLISLVTAWRVMSARSVLASSCDVGAALGQASNPEWVGNMPGTTEKCNITI